MFNTRNIKYYFLFFILLFVVLAPAQRKKKNVIAKTKTSIPVTRNGIYESLLQSTAKVMFVDSIVVDKDNFLQFIPQPKEMGTISLSKDSFGLVQYQNELGDRRFFAVGDTAASDLKIQTSFGSSWGEPVNLVGINNREYFVQNYPFLAADGITLFFSAKSTYSMGGRDIFMTSFDSDKGTWLQPQNYGLPFNSPFNEYFLAISDIDTLGWLVTDRYQTEDKVCIYTFVPTTVRQNFEADGLSDVMLRSFADIKSIKDTWKFGDRQAAMLRLKRMKDRMKEQLVETGLSFVINDTRIVNSINEFHAVESRNLFSQLVEIKRMLNEGQKDLEQLRLQYEGNISNRSTLRQSILKAEQALQRQRNDINTIEKKIRNIENKYKN